MFDTCLGACCKKWLPSSHLVTEPVLLLLLQLVVAGTVESSKLLAAAASAAVVAWQTSGQHGDCQDARGTATLSRRPTGIMDCSRGHHTRW